MEGVVFWLAAFAAYMLPGLIAYGRGHHQQNAIGALNLFLGWTALGWIAALVWALTAVDPARSTPPIWRRW